MNAVTLIGRLTRDPNTRSVRDGMAIATLRLAIDRRKRNGESQDPVYVDVVCFDKQAETCAKYLAKGSMIGVLGRLEHSEWKAQDGSSRSKHEVIAHEVAFLSPRSQAAEQQEPSEPSGDAAETPSEVPDDRSQESDQPAAAAA